MKHRSQPQFDHNYNPYEKPGLSEKLLLLIFRLASIIALILIGLIWKNADAIDVWMNQ